MKRYLHRSLLSACLALYCIAAHASESTAEFPFKAGDRVAWIGSSSTRIGTWCRTLEFLLRTRHPELKLTFSRGTTGGGTFLTGVKNLPMWLGEMRPTYVLFNYGGNDAAAGPKGLPQFKLNMQKCFELVRDSGAKVQFLPPQSGDVRATALQPLEYRKLYAEEMLDFAKQNGWVAYDTHHPLEAFQAASQKEVPDFTINRDRIHLTDCSYVAWGCFIYERMNPPVVESRAELDASGKVLATRGCAITDVIAGKSVLEFTRSDSVLPLLPPEPIPGGYSLLKNSPTTPGAAAGAAMKDAIKEYYKAPAKPIIPAVSTQPKIPGDSSPAASTDANNSAQAAKGPSGSTPAAKPAAPPFKIPAAQVAYAAKFGQQLPRRELVPMENVSRYMLKITNLETGQYEISCEGKPIGCASASEFQSGVNLNTLLLDAKNVAPWNDFLRDIWVGKRLDEIGTTHWKFRVEKK
jgi:hypothetical protein